MVVSFSLSLGNYWEGNFKIPRFAGSLWVKWLKMCTQAGELEQNWVVCSLCSLPLTWGQSSALRSRGLENAILEPMSMTVFRSLYSVNYGLEFNLYIHIKVKAWYHGFVIPVPGKPGSWISRIHLNPRLTSGPHTYIHSCAHAPPHMHICKDLHTHEDEHVKMCTHAHAPTHACTHISKQIKWKWLYVLMCQYL